MQIKLIMESKCISSMKKTNQVFLMMQTPKIESPSSQNIQVCNYFDFLFSFSVKFFKCFCLFLYNMYRPNLRNLLVKKIDISLNFTCLIEESLICLVRFKVVISIFLTVIAFCSTSAKLDLPFWTLFKILNNLRIK